MNPKAIDQSLLSPEEKRALLAQLLREKAAKQQEAPLAHGQRALWFLYELAPESAAYNVVASWKVASALDSAALRRAFDLLIQRHAALRTIFESRDGEPVQIVGHQREAAFQEWDGRAWTGAELDRHLEAEIHRPFDLRRGPVFRVDVVRRRAHEAVLTLAFHHIVGDFWSMMRLLTELAHIYGADIEGRPITLPRLRSSYREYVRWQGGLLASQDGERSWQYWQSALAGELPVLTLPVDRPHPPVQTYAGASVIRSLDAGLTRELRELAKSQGVTLFTVLLAVYDVLLHRYSGQSDVIVGSPVAGRSRPEFEDLVGYFINSVPLRANLAGDPRFDALLQQVRSTVLEALEHQDYPSTMLVERMKTSRRAGQSALFQTLFVLNRPHHLDDGVIVESDLDGTVRMNLGGLALESLPIHQRTAMLDLALMVLETDASLVTAWQYNTDLFDAATVERMAGAFDVLLRSVVDAPARRISRLRLQTHAEDAHVLDRCRSAEAAPDGPGVHELFEQQAQRTPAAIALTGGDRTLTYDELDRRTNQLARHLTALGVGPEARVALWLDRSVESIVALLGVLKAGGAYVPLDASSPPARVASIREDVRPVALITQASLKAVVPYSTRVVALDAEWPAISRESDAPVSHRAAARDLAYIIYTSGSTGRPKGVAIEHRSLTAYTRTAAREYALTPADRVLQFASISFDAAAEEIYPTLACGASLVLRSPTMIESVSGFLRECAAERLTVLDLPTAYWHEIVAQLEVATAAWPESVRLVILGGERALPDWLARWRRHIGPHVRVMNTYGPTEATIVATMCDVTRAGEPAIGLEVPIGRTVAGARAYVLDDQLSPVPVGVSGELCLGGVGLARGYLDRPDLTAERFVPDPFADEPGERLYRTGDRARLRPDGLLEVVGRLDSQVKLRGFRVELGEIEAVLRQHAEVRDCVVVLRDDQPGGKRLVAYWIGDVSEVSVTRVLKAFVKERLPEYMVPAAFVRLDALPLTSAGKVDRRALPAPVEEAADAPPPVLRSDLERTIAAAWRETLGVGRVGPDDNFFDLGGHSLLFAQVQSRLAALGWQISMVDLFRFPTVESLAAHLGGGSAAGDAPLAATVDHRAQRQKDAIARQQRQRLERSVRS